MNLDELERIAGGFGVPVNMLLPDDDRNGAVAESLRLMLERMNRLVDELEPEPETLGPASYEPDPDPDEDQDWNGDTAKKK